MTIRLLGDWGKEIDNQSSFSFVNNDGVKLTSLSIENADLKNRLIETQKELEKWKSEAIMYYGQVQGLNMAIKSFNFPDDPTNNLG